MQPRPQQQDDFTIGQYVLDAAAILSEISESPRLDAEILMGLVLKKPRSYLHAWPEKPLDLQESANFEALVRRRYSGEPIAYITGIKEFWSIPLRVSPQVLIPRPDTELLVEKALTHIPDEDDIHVLDLGTGSGAITFAIARERPRALVTGVDNSPDALRIARLNRKALGAENTEFFESNWFDAVRGRKFHVIVSNPPYVINRDEFLMKGELRFEPPDALAGGDEGMDCIGEIVDRAHNYIIREGWLLFEHGEAQQRAVQRVLEAQRYYEICCYQDAAGNDRVTECRFVE